MTASAMPSASHCERWSAPAASTVALARVPAVRSKRGCSVSPNDREGGELMSDVIVTTMNDLPGYTVSRVYGEVFGLTVRSRHVGSDIGASLKGLVGGEIKGYTKMLIETRNQSIERLRDAAREAGANAV